MLALGLCLPAPLQFLEACLGVEQLQRISEALTRPPLATCIRVNTLRTAAEVGEAGGGGFAGGGLGQAESNVVSWSRP